MHAGGYINDALADRYALERIPSGIKKYVLKSDAATDLVDALHAIAKCETHVVRF
jgi:hypothetical protein